MLRFGAIDIGSNSVRLKITDTAIPSKGLPELHPITDYRKVTRLGETVFQAGRCLSESAMKETFDALTEMAKMCDSASVLELRAIATSAVRDAKNHLEFLDGARKILNVSVDVASGPEEADLVHLGVNAHGRQLGGGNTLVVDLGGGSTQFIYGDPGATVEKISRPLGAVRLKQMFLEHDPPRKGELRKMNRWIDSKLTEVAETFEGIKFDRMIVTSGTAATVVCMAHKLRRADREYANTLGVSLSQAKSLYSQLSKIDLDKRRGTRGIGSRRAEVIVPGLAIIKKILTVSGLPTFTYSSAGVADGIIVKLAMNRSTRATPQVENFHVFLCHNHEDKPAIRDLALRLRDRGILPWLDEEQLQPGLPWQDALDRQIHNISSAAVFIGPDGIGPWQNQEVHAFLRQFRNRNCPVIPVMLPKSREEPKLPMLLDGMTFVDFRRPTPDPLKQLIWGITGQRPPGLTSAKS